MNKNGIGFLTIAQNTDEINYSKLAYVQALNFKVSNPTLPYAIIVDAKTKPCLDTYDLNPFDYVIELNIDLNHPNSNWKLANELQVFELSPFKETIKVESDLLISKDIQHWFPLLRQRDLVIATGCKTFQSKTATARDYRKFFDENSLPDLYSGLMYFRYSKFAATFFRTAKDIWQNWKHIKNYAVKNSREETPSTDVLYAVTASVLGVENCCIPTYDAFSFVHLKPAINQWLNYDWHDAIMHEFDDNILRVNNLNQYDPVHYHCKNFINDEIITYFEQIYEKSRI